MALRVLLADESSTIKKVFQLALQDFAVDVRPVNIGVDVATVAQSFKPDIVFADVLLQKKNGYDVSSELKQHPELGAIPVVLMWSGFMELDEDKFQASKADAQLEKPFDVAALRKLVTDLVPRTQGQRLSQFLSFPKMPELDEPPRPPAAKSEVEEEDFQQVSIPKMKGSGADKFRLNLSPEELESDHLPVEFNTPSEAPPSLKPEDEELEEFSFSPNTIAKATTSPGLELEEVERTPPPAPAMAAPQLSEEQLEKIIRAQSAEIIESVVWKVIPELATQIIERELNRLLKERDAHP